jgi:superfamily II DNA or RNA helicase
VLSPADEAVVRQLVGPATFVRGSLYAQQGAVRSRHWEDHGTRVLGLVQGGAEVPYQAAVRLIRTEQQLAAVEGTCTCPVGFNCKHAVALLLARDVPDPRAAPEPPEPDDTGPVRAAGRARLTLVPGGAAGGSGPVSVGGAPADGEWEAGGWETPLHALLGEAGPDHPTVAVELELVPFRPRPGREPGTEVAGPGIRIRPVVPGAGGNWVRAGVSWGGLEALAHRVGAGPAEVEKVQVLRELLALSRMGQARWSSAYREEIVWLESLDSRRLWDLLAQAQDLRIPLLRSGRGTQPVTLHERSAGFAIDVTRRPSGLRLGARVDLDGTQVPLASSLLIGSPAHGIAWWGRPEGPGLPPPLSLAPFMVPVEQAQRGLLGTAPVTVPAADEERFLRDFLPVLRRRVAVSSSDGSVGMPEAAPAVLILTVTSGVGHRVSLRWTRGSVGPGEALWSSRVRTKDRAAEDAVAESVQRMVSELPDLLERTPFGERLASESRLEGMAAVRFVSELVPALANLRGVVVERVGVVPDYREAEDRPVVHLGGTASGDGDWFDLSLAVTVGGEEVPFGDLFVALAEERSHLILPSGTYFTLDGPELRQLAELIAEARAMRDPGDDGIRLSRFQATMWDDLRQLGVVTAQAGEWEASVRALAEADEQTSHPAPAGLQATLRPYQLQGFNWLASLYQHHLGGVLADDMGLGKTLQALALMVHAREHDRHDGPFLVVAPTSVVENWAIECRRFAPGLSVATITGTTARRGSELAALAGESDVVITSYALFRLEYGDYAALRWAGLFLDEAQFAKNRTSQAYQRAKALPVRFKVAMTGTPMENNLMELWSLLSITSPGLFPNPERFGEYYRIPIERHGDAERLVLFRRRIRPLMLRRTKEQVADDLPDKTEQVLELELNPRHRKLYQTYLQRERQKVLGLLGDMGRNRFEIFRSLTLLRQAALDVSLIDPEHADVPSTKLDALMEMLGEIAADGHRVLVFSQFTRFLGLARHRLSEAGVAHCYLDGSTRDRAGVISEFRTGTAPVFLISLKAGGFGLNLTEADYCVLLDPWWNPATEAQAVDRIHRIGQTRKVMVYRLVARDTLEEKVMALKARKASLFTSVVDAGGFESGALTAEDVRSLLS